MILKIKIYTTSKSKFFEKDLSLVRDTLMQSKGREDIIFDVEYISPPHLIPTIRDKDGHRRPTWDWIHTKFVEQNKGKYNAVGFHFTPYYKDKWRISDVINASYHVNRDGVMDFWFCCKNEPAKYQYDFNEAVRLLVHEISHGDSSWTEKEDLVHIYDYNMKSIDTYPRFIDYVKWNTQKKIVEILTQTVYLLKKLLWKT